MSDRMAKLTLIIMALAAIALIAFAQTTPRIQYKLPADYSMAGTLQTHARQIAAVTSAETDLTYGTKDWDSIGTPGTQGVSNFQQIPVGWNAVSLYCYAWGDGNGAGDPNDATLSYSVYVCDYFGGAKSVAKGTGTVGAVQLSDNPTTGDTTLPLTGVDAFAGVNDVNFCWVDTFSLSAGDIWKGTTTASGEDGDETGGNIASLELDLFGSWMICVKTTAITNASAVVWLMKPSY